MGVWQDSTEAMTGWTKAAAAADESLQSCPTLLCATP